MNKKVLDFLKIACLIIAATGMYIVMLKKPEDNLLNIPIFLSIIIAIALSALRPKK